MHITTQNEFKEAIKSKTNSRYNIVDSLHLTGNLLENEVFDYWNFRGIVFSGVSFKQVRFVECDFRNCYFDHCTFLYCEFDKCSAADSMFRENRFANVTMGMEVKFCSFDNSMFRHNCDMTNFHWDYTTPSLNMRCPSHGSYVAWKVSRSNNALIKLQIPASAKRSSATSAKCRASAAKVLDIREIGTNKRLYYVHADYDWNFVYIRGSKVSVDNFCENRWDECAPGIHHFMSPEEALTYNT